MAIFLEIMEKIDEELKMGADNLAQNTSNTPKFICPICLPKPKSFQ